MAMEPVENESSIPSPEPMSEDQFAHGDPRAMYARMRPDQRTAIAGEFARAFRLSGDAEASAKYGENTAGMVEPEWVAEMHTYARIHHPEIFAEVMRHPVTQASLQAPGAEPDEVNPEAEQAIGTHSPGATDKPTRVEPGLMP
ncbi:MAG: hypothetical protein ACRDHP_03570 [Ktedonobacterales bacterium]